MDLILKHTILGENETARIILQVIKAVNHMHQSFIVHRDIKPENILFKTSEPNSDIRLIDFGMAC
jgi:serine/threonine protein kinase